MAASFDGTAVRLVFGIPAGATGAPITSYVVDGVTTLEPGQGATAAAAFDGTSVRFTFGIPRGNDGAPGVPGLNGEDGLPGAPGVQRPAFTSFAVAGVNALEPAQPATVTTAFDGTSILFTFGLPRGNDSLQGPPGELGPQDLSDTARNRRSPTSALR